MKAITHSHATEQKQAARIRALESTLKILVKEAEDNAISLGVFIGLIQSTCDYRIGSEDEALEAMRQLVEESEMLAEKPAPAVAKVAPAFLNWRRNELPQDL